MPPWLENWLMFPQFNLLDAILIALMFLAGIGGHVWRLWRARVLTRPDAWLYAVLKSLAWALLFGGVWILPGAVDRVSDAEWAGVFWVILAIGAAIAGEPALRKTIPPLGRRFADLDARVEALFALFGRGDRYPDKPLNFVEADRS